MSRYIKYLALCFASIFLITTAPLQAWGAGENSSLAATAGSTLAEAAETSATADSAEKASPDEAAAFFYEHDPMENPRRLRTSWSTQTLCTATPPGPIPCV